MTVIPDHHPPAHGGTSGGSFFKKHKTAVIAGGGIGAILLMSHKGGGSASTNSQGAQNLQSEADALAAQQQDLLANNPTAGYGDGSGSYGTTGNGGDTGTGSGTVTGTAPSATPPALGSGPDPISGIAPVDVTPGNAPVSKGGGTQSKHSAEWKAHHHNGRYYKQADYWKSHPEVGNPANTERNTGSGVTVHGRTFPGGRHVTAHPAHRVNGQIHQKITVNHGGYTTSHISVNNGQSWIDNAKGSTPPSRGPQARHISEPIPRAKVKHPEPKRRPVPHRKVKK